MSEQEEIPHQTHHSIYEVSVSNVKYGKKMTIIRLDGDVSTDKMRMIAKELKKRLGAGGTVKDGVIEIQGDHRNRMSIIDRVVRKYYS